MQPWRLFGLENASPAERRATFWVAAMFFASLCATFLLRPLRDQFGVDRGVEQLPYLYSLTLLATVVVVLPFWWLANRMSSRRFVPLMLNVFTLAVGLLAVGLWAIGPYDWKQLPWLGEVFWGGFSAMNVAVPALVWIHAVEHYGKEQARRSFGLVAVGGTLGALVGSWGASALAGYEADAGWLAGVASAVALQSAAVAFRASWRYCPELAGGDTSGRFDRGGLWQGMHILLADRRAQWIAVYMVLFGVVATAFYAAQTELVGQEIASGADQHRWLANLETWSQAVVLFLQVFCTGRLLGRLSSVWLLVSLPLVSMLGLSIWWLVPTAAAIFFVQIARRGARFALEKPAREVLYTPFDLATKHKVKFLLDTFAYRLGDLLGAFLQVGMREMQLSTGAIVLITVLFAGLAIVVSVAIVRGQSVRRDRRRLPAPAEAGAEDA